MYMYPSIHIHVDIYRKLEEGPAAVGHTLNKECREMLLISALSQRRASLPSFNSDTLCVFFGRGTQ